MAGVVTTYRSIAVGEAGIDGGGAVDRLLSLLNCVDGDYGDASTFKALTPPPFRGR
jgi:hypothetical protein